MRVRVLVLCVALAGCAPPVARPVVEWPVPDPSTFEPTPEPESSPTWNEPRLLGDWYHC